MAGKYDIAVIGGGIAGFTAAQHALEGGGSVVHIVGGEPIGGLVCNIGALNGYAAGNQPLSGIELALGLSEANATRGGQMIPANVNTLSQDTAGFHIATPEGDFAARQVIAATGARLRMLDVPGARELAGRGVSQCAWCDGALYKGREVVVIGGGDAALEEAHHLAQFAAKITVITHGDGFRARQHYVDRLAELDTIDFRWMSDVTQIIGTDMVEAVRVESKEDKTTEIIACSGAFVFIGLEPNSASLQGLVRLNAEGGVLTNDAMATDTPGLYAVGAVRSGYKGRLVHAVGEAATAAMDAISRCE